MNKKFEFTGETKAILGNTLHRIRALISFGEVGAGELGGWIEKEENLDAFRQRTGLRRRMGFRQRTG